MSSNVFAANVYYAGNIFGPTGEQLTQSTPTIQKIQDLAGGFSNGAPGIITSTSVVGTGVTQSTLSPFTNALEGSVFLPGSASSYISTVNANFNQNWRTNQMTTEGWFYFPSFAQGTSSFFGHYQTSGGGFDWTFNASTGGVFTFYYWNGTVGNTATGPTLSTNTWYHICVQSDGTNIFIFSNGTLSSTTAISGTPVITSTYPLVFGPYNSLAPPAFYVSSPRLTFGANLYSQGSFTAPTNPLGIAPTGQTVMLLRNPLYSSMTLKNPLNAQSSARVRCLPSDALIYLDAYGSNVPNKAPLSNAPTFDPYGTGAVLFRSAQSQFLDLGRQTFNVSSKGFSIVVKFSPTGTPGSFERLFESGSAAAGSAGSYLINIQRNGTSGSFYASVVNSSNPGVTATMGTVPQNGTGVFTLVYDPNTQLLSGYLNGTLTQATSAAPTAVDFPDRLSLYTQVGAAISPGNYGNFNIFTLAVYNRPLTSVEITDASAMLTQVSPVVPSTVEIGNVNGRPSLTVDATGSVSVLGPLNGQAGGYTPVDLGINSLSLVTGNLTPNISVTSFSPLGPSEGSLTFPGVANTYISFGTTGQPFSNSNIYAFGDFVVEAWVNPASFSTSQYFVNGGDPMTGAYWFLAANQTSGTLAWFSFINGVSNSFNTTNSLSLGTWQHVAVIHQSANRRFQVYINGQPQTGTVSSGTNGFAVSGTVVSYTYGIVPALTNFVIGQNGSLSPLTGSLTNLRIVTGSGAAQIYNNNAFVPSTSPLFPASNTAGGSLTTRLLLRVPQTSGKVQMNKITGAPGSTTGVVSFPPAPMTGYLTDLTGQAPYGQGKYIASASSEYSSSYIAWYAFDQTANEWATDSTKGASYAAGSYAYTGSTTTVDVSGNSYGGEWCQIQLPVSIVVSSYYLYRRYAAVDQPTSWVVLGSRDGTNWTLFDQRIVAAAVNTGATYTVGTSPQAFSFFRYVIRVGNGSPAPGLGQWTLNGSIESINLTGDGRVGVGVVNPTRTLEVAGDVVCGGTLSAGNPLMFRNALYNGDMRINQRGVSTNWASPTAIGTAGTGLNYGLDRMNTYRGSFAAGGSIAQGTLATTDQPFLDGLRNYLRVGRTSGNATADGIIMNQALESRDSYRFAGQPVTVSAYYRTGSGFSGSGITVNFYYGTGTDQNAGTGFTNGATLSSPSFPASNAWQRVSFTSFIPLTTSQISIYVSYTPSGTAGGFDYFDATGVQLEKGLVATPFEIRPFATELALCQRYYYQFSSAVAAYTRFGGGFASTTSAVYTYMQFPVTMRAQPTLVSNSAATTFAIASSSTPFPGWAVTSFTVPDISVFSASPLWVSSAAFTAGASVIAIANGTTSAFLGFSAEL